MSSDVEKCLYGFFEAILDEMSDGIYITDREGTTICVNKMYEQLTGLRKDDIRGRDVRDLVGSGVFDIALNPEIVKTGKPTTHVQHLKDGKTLVLSGYPVFDDDGGLRFVVTFARDITLMTRLNDQINRQRSLVSQTAGQIEYVARRQLLKSQSPTFASQSMKRVITLVDRVAPTDATVLILGETGVGKDVIARLIHNKSSRRDKLMLKVDCGGISETLTESEMFGYVGGAFTGASSKGKAGYFEIANGSTVFLDEIGELPLSMQTRLLRVLQDGEIVRVGSSQPRKVDVRVIAATNKNLKECVDAGTFRRDLYYRLTVLLFRGRLRDGLYETGDIHAMIFCLSVFVHRRTRIHCCQDVYPGLGLDAQLVEEWDKSRRYGDFKVDPAAAALGLGIGNPMSYVEKNFAVGLLAQRRSVVEPVADKGVGNEDRYHEILLSQSNCCVVCSRFAETKKVPADDISSTDTFWIR